MSTNTKDKDYPQYQTYYGAVVKNALWQDGFQEAYRQAMNVVRHGHTNIKDPAYEKELLERIDKLQALEEEVVE